MKYFVAYLWVLKNRPLRMCFGRNSLGYVIAQTSLRANYWSLENRSPDKLRGNKTFLGHRYYYLAK